MKRAQRYHHEAIESIKRGQKYLANRNLEKALTDCSEVIRIDPNHLSAYILRARIYEERGEDAKAEADLEKARQLEG